VILMYKQGFRLAGQCDASRTAMRLGIFMLQAIAMVGYVLNELSSLPWVVLIKGLLIFIYFYFGQPFGGFHFYSK
jgi:hypothetical protein